MKRTAFLFVLAVATLALVGSVMAQGRRGMRGQRGQRMYGPGYMHPGAMGPGMMGYGMMGPGMMGPGWGTGAYDSKESKEIYKEFQKFQDDTLKLRQQFLSKILELRSMLADPGSSKSALLVKQREYHELASRLDELKISFAKDLQTKYPNTGYYYGMMLGSTMMMGSGMMGPGMMMGPGTMGPAMMGPGMWGYGWPGQQEEEPEE